MNNLYLQAIDKDIAKRMIIRNHYSHAWTMCSVALGIYEKGKPNEFFDGITDDTLIGCMIYGNPVGINAAESVSPLITQGQIYELTRLWIRDGTPKNTETHCLGLSFDWLRKNQPHIKCIISYVDPSMGHKGTIYAASNFLFQSLDNGPCGGVTVSRTGPPNYKWIHPRTIGAQLGTRSWNVIKDKLPKPFWIKTIVAKYRYIYLLGNKIERKQIIKTLKHPILPHPKELTPIDDAITMITDDSSISDSIFNW